ncbi:MAG: MBL fold metallo-hydrolase [Chloroflexota bacterium]|nr:MBL fold metallo-hydrolase [Chloroflexota bacterium]MDE2685498.1 MBL fold metallo-hydrolase [Chloroflexota bacterium]
MRLTYFGHCAFRWETPSGVTVIADPYRNAADRYWFTRLFPQVRYDLGLITHAHFDHDAVDRLPEAASVLRMPGDFAAGDIRIRGVRDLHSGASRLRDFPNVMFRLESNGVRFLHIGDNRVEWPADVAQAVGDVDVLLVTVDDSSHLLTYEQVDSLVERLQPRVVIPMHYAIPGLHSSECELLPPGGWLKRQPEVRRLQADRFEFTERNLPAQTEVWLFQPASASLSAPEIRR